MVYWHRTTIGIHQFLFFKRKLIIQYVVVGPIWLNKGIGIGIGYCLGLFKGIGYWYWVQISGIVHLWFGVGTMYIVRARGGRRGQEVQKTECALST